MPSSAQPHVVIITNGMSSLLHAGLEAGRRLRAAGHRVTFVAPGRHVTRIAGEGETVVGLDHDERFAVDSTDSADAIGSLRDRFRRRRRSIDAAELLAVIDRLEPDLLVIDIEVHTAIVATAGIDVPRVLAMNYFSVFRSPGLPPLNSTLGPAGGLGGNVRIGAAWWKLRIGTEVGRIRHRISRAGLAALVTPMRFDSVDPLDHRLLAAKLGLSLRAMTDRTQWLRPHVARDLPVLCYNAWELELPHRPSPRIHYVGPMVSTDRREPPLSPDRRRRWERLVAARAGSGPGRPLVYASFGTFWSGDDRLIRQLLALFGRRPDWDLVLGLGGRSAELEGQTVPDNVLVLDWAPQLEVLAEADVAVTHGGVGTLCEAIHFGVPVVVYSTGYVDQNGNAARVTHHGVGVTGDPDRDGPAEIEANIERVFDDPAIGAAVERMRGHFARARQQDRLVTLIEQWSAVEPRSVDGTG